MSNGELAERLDDLIDAVSNVIALGGLGRLQLASHLRGDYVPPDYQGDSFDLHFQQLAIFERIRQHAKVIPPMLDAGGLGVEDVLELGHHADNGDWAEMARGWTQRKVRLQRTAIRLRAKAEPDNDADKQGAGVGTADEFTGPLSAPDIARKFGIPLPALESALRREREKRPDCFVETDDGRRVNDPKYLYRVPEIRSIIVRLQARKMTDG